MPEFESNKPSFGQAGRLVLQALEEYLVKSQSGEGKVLIQQNPEILAQELELDSLMQNGLATSGAIRSFLEKYLSNTQHMHHPNYMGHQVAVPQPMAAMAELIHGVVNNPMAIYEMGPAAAAIEKYILNWMLRKVGWFNAESVYESDDEKIGGGGVLTHGGSLANLTALLAARARACPDSWGEGLEQAPYILAPAHAHYSIARAASIMGIGSSRVLPIPVDHREVIRVKELKSLIETCQGEDKKIMAVVANACATASGLYDPLDEIGDLCREKDLWLHVDGAHGAVALLLEKEKMRMKGVEKADSLIWDAHKMLRTPALSAAVLFRKHEDLARTFRQNGSYLFFDKEKIGYDFMYHTVECTKAALGTKIFWALASEGEATMASYVQSVFDQTKVFYQMLAAEPDFECPYYPESNILCFRYTGSGDTDSFQLDLRNRLVMKGDFYITSTEFTGKRYLRLVLMNPDTRESHLIALMDEIRKLGKTNL